MKIGLIADTHDRLEKIEKAVAFFNSQELDLVIHAGDYVAPFTARVFSDLQVDMKGIFGNNDGEKPGLLRAYQEIMHIEEAPYSFKVDDASIVVVHMDQNLDTLMKDHDIVVYAHSHQYDSKKEHNTVLINPGECCGYLSGMSTVGILDTKTLESNIFQLQ
ncbi:MAG: YfcE family phosphodiesterase [Elusimicrobia bacterium]|nr:YfcE family phosphodiesterase [Elusimicrobiota bacterium]MBD3412244.1 YfcE family phosphodiesterase [Elusimicrobiota bacterium]